jgi:hypothetical protein
VNDHDDQPGDFGVTPDESADNRGEERVELWLHGATFREMGCSAAPVTVHDLSRSGFRVEWPYRVQRDSTVFLKLPGFESMVAKVAWCASFELGCKFDHPLNELIFERIVAASRSAV